MSDVPDNRARLGGDRPQSTGGASTAVNRLTITELRLSGRGRARHDGALIEVRGVDVGEVVDVESVYDPIRRRVMHRLVRIVEPSKQRVEPDCRFTASCPGCPVRGLDRSYLAATAESIQRAVLAGVIPLDVPWQRVPTSGDLGTRSRAVARALLDREGRLVLGMGEPGREPTPLGDCPLQVEAVGSIIDVLQRDLRAQGCTPWDVRTRTGTLRHVIVHGLGDAARVILAVDGRGPPIDFDRVLVDRPDVDLFIDHLPRRGAGLTKHPRLVRGDPWLSFAIDGDRFRARPRSWIPQTPGTISAVRALVMQWARPDGQDVLEIGCGVGILSLPLARRAASLIGVDVERDAVLDAVDNARAAGLSNARFRTGDAAHALRRLRMTGVEANVAVLHAMRRPFGDEAMGHLAGLAPERVVYLGPHAPAVGRDLAALVDYRPVAVALVDQTPGTLSDLVIVLLERR